MFGMQRETSYFSFKGINYMFLPYLTTFGCKKAKYILDD